VPYDPDQLPYELARQSRMEKEIALPYPAVLEAIDALEAQDIYLLGWEPLATRPDGRFGTYPAPGIGGLSLDLPSPDEDWRAAVERSAAIHRDTIKNEWRTRASSPPQEGVELIFCITPQVK
jgi:hypothetical protein